MEPFEFKDEAMPFIIFNEDSQKFNLTDDAKQMLQNIPDTIGVISVAGMYRTGKSYLLNRILVDAKTKVQGFGVGPTIQPCTKGLWIWGKPIDGLTPEGKPVKILIVDSEGIGAPDEDSNHDMRIFSLAILLSSYFVYNSMGTIDEHALQNMGLVVNLTKHIHIKSHEMNHEDIDSSEFASYFPSFMWVVRDFSLQLSDSDGEPITAKEYLENALKEQVGISDQVEEKNRIRRTIKAIFQERDCCTMIRPLTDEEKLQELEQMDFNELRPEFVQQIQELRLKLLQRMKIKQINGKDLNGPMLAHLADTYITAINQGSVPNIENAWTYICHSECNKSLELALDKFEQYMNPTSGNSIKMPLDEIELQSVYQSAKNESILIFEQSSVGDMAEEFREQLEGTMLSKYDELIEENTNISRRECEQFLEESYQQIEDNLRSQHFETYEEYFNTLTQYKIYFMNSGPRGPHRELIMYDFILAKLNEASEFFTREASKISQVNDRLFKDQIANLENDKIEQKEEFRRELDLYEKKVKESELEKVEISAREQSQKDMVQSEKDTRKQLEDDFKEKLSKVKQDLSQQIDQLKIETETADSKVQEMTRKVIQSSSEFDKDKTLLENKINHQQSIISEYEKQQKGSQSEMSSIYSIHSQQIKDQQQDHEDQIKNLKSLLEESEEKNQDSNEDELIMLREKYESYEEKMTDKSNNTSEEIKSLQATIEELKNVHSTEISSFSSQNKLSILDLNTKISDKEEFIKKLDTEFKKQQNLFDKDKAIYEQKLTFQEQEISSWKMKTEENESDHEKIIQNLIEKDKESVNSRDSVEDELRKIKNDFITDIKDLETKVQDLEKDLVDKTNFLMTTETELQGFKQQIELTKEEHQKVIEQITDEKSELSSKLQNVNSAGMKSLEDREENWKQEQDRLERELEDKDDEVRQMLEEAAESAQTNLEMIKESFEKEKVRLSNTINELKQKQKETIDSLNDENEIKNRSETERLDLENMELRENLDEMQASFNMEYKELMDRYSKQEFETGMLKHQISEKEMELDKQKNNQESKLENKLSKFQSLIYEYDSKIEKIKLELAQKERLINEASNEHEKYKESMDRSLVSIEEDNTRLSSDLKEASSKLEKVKEEKNQYLELYEKKNSQFENNQLLHEQNKQFNTEKIDRLTEQIKEKEIQHQETFKQMQSSKEAESGKKITQMKAEMEDMVLKLDKQKILQKEIEVKLMTLEKDKAVLEQQLLQFEDKSEAAIQKIQSEKDAIISQLEDLKTSVEDDEEKSNLKKENAYLTEEIKLATASVFQIQELEKENALLKASTEFLQEQKKSLKEDKEEIQNKMTQQVNSLLKKNRYDKDKGEKSQYLLMQKLDQKHKTQLDLMKEVNSKKEFEQKSKIDDLEKQLKQLKDEKWEQKINGQSMGKKVEDYKELESQLKSQLLKEKTSAESKISEVKAIQAQEKMKYKKKNSELQTKLSSLTQEKQHYVFQTEMDKQSNTIEKEKLKSEMNALTEKNQKLSQDNLALVRKNEAMRNDARSSRHKNPWTSQDRPGAMYQFGASYIKPGQRGQSKISSASSVSSGNNEKENSTLPKPEVVKFISDKMDIEMLAEEKECSKIPHVAQICLFD